LNQRVNNTTLYEFDWNSTLSDVTNLSEFGYIVFSTWSVFYSPLWY